MMDMAAFVVRSAFARSASFGGQIRSVLPAAGLNEFGAGNGIRTRDFDLGKVALYH
jgi:hypothetical protein